MRNDVLIAMKLADMRKTNHVLHLLLTIITLGVWAPLWVLIHANNLSHNQTTRDEAMRMADREPERRGFASELLRSAFFLLLLALTAIVAMNGLAVLSLI